MLCFRCGSYNVDEAKECTVCGQALHDEQAGRGRDGKKANGKPSVGSFEVGEVVGGKYRIDGVIGQGGVGTVYRATDTEVDVTVALKAISPNLLQTEDERRLFSKMMKQARKLNHANIVRLYDEGAEGNRRYVTMKLLEGLTLRKVIRLRHDKTQAFTPEELGPIFLQLGAALDYAHKTTWHGDLKPENVIILPDLLKVTDFNLVKGLPLKPFLGIAKSRSKGFPYIAPELRVESTQVDGRADVYSLGVILCEMLTGLVYEGYFSRAITAALEQLPTRLDGLVRRALSEHPDGRFQRAGEMARDLERILADLPPGVLPAIGESSPVRATPPPPPMETNPSAAAPRDVEAADGDEGDEDASLVELGQSQVLLLSDDGHPVSAQLDRTVEGRPTSPRGAALVSSEVVSSEVVSSEVVSSEVVSSEVMSSGTGSAEPSSEDNGEGTGEASDDDAKAASLEDRVLLEGGLGSSGDDVVEQPPPLPAVPDADPSVSLDLPPQPPVAHPGERSLRRLRDDVEEESTVPDRVNVGIHEELTALTPSPRAPEPTAALNEEDGTDAPRAESPEARALPFAPGEEPVSAEPDDEDDASLVETVTRGVLPNAPGAAGLTDPPAVLSAAELEEAAERAAPRRHDAEPLAPPLLQATAAVTPPGLRRVTPPGPRRSSQGPLVAAFAVIAAVVVLVAVLFSGGDSEATGDGIIAQAVTAPPAAAELPFPEPRPDNGSDAAEAPSTGADVVTEVLPDEAPEPVAPAAPAEPPRAASAQLPAPVAADDPLPDVDVAAQLREAEREAALARERAEAEELRRRAEDARPKPAEPASVLPPKDTGPKLAVATPAASGTLKCPAGMQLIPAGPFSMGSAPSDPMRNFGEGLATKTDVAAFCIDYYEFPNSSSRAPTVRTTWSQAKAACEGKGRRLCAEAEWEKACKGPGDKRFPYGNNYDEAACNIEGGGGQAHQPDSARAFKACRSGYGVYALSGNAEEWVADAFKAGTSSKTAKGGAADRPDWASRCAARRGLASNTSRDTLGFRCCADPG